MKKMKLAVVFAALVSVFGFSSCLDSGESGPQQLQWPVNINTSYLGSTVFTPDGAPGFTLTTDAMSLTQYGIPEGTKRAFIRYTIPEGQEMNQESKTQKIELVPGSCIVIPIANISNRPDTLQDYTSKIKQFTPVIAGVPGVYTNDRYLIINCSYEASEVAKVGLVPNRVSAAKDTLYLDLKLKTKEGYRQGETFFATNYDLSSCHDFFDLVASNKTQDSVYVTVRALSVNAGQEKVDSITTQAIYRY